MAKSTKSRRRKESPKPYDGFPLTHHRGTDRWCKKHKQKQFYFGAAATDGDKSQYESAWRAALKRYEREWPYILDDREPPPDNERPGGGEDTNGYCTVRTLCNAFLRSKKLKLQSDELSADTFDGYHRTCARLISHFGRGHRVDDLRPTDFERYRSVLTKRLATVSLKNEINRCRIVFKYASDQGLIERPVRYGQSFDRPSAKMLRKARNAAGSRMFEADELRRILAACDGLEVLTGQVDEESSEPATIKLKSDPVLKAMILLGVNCGFGNTDIANLPQSAVDLDSGWVDFPRPKTEIHRRVALWQETVEAMRVAIDRRPQPSNRADADLCFLTVQGNRWVRVNPSLTKENKYVTVNTLAKRFGTLRTRLNINGKRGFYALRHTFETIGGESRDQVAVNAIMGHVDNNMAGVYRERISDERLKAVVETVRSWLWPREEKRAISQRKEIPT